MKKIIIAAAVVFAAFSAEAQVSLDQVLASVEARNPSLEARRRLTVAQILEAKTGNSLENPEAEYIYSWGKPGQAGDKQEIGITQGFDFPTVYARRGRLAKIYAVQYGYEYASFRQEVLLEAKLLYIEIAALRQRRAVLGRALADAEGVERLVRKRGEAGDANALEENKAKFELVAAHNAYQLNEIELASALERLAALGGGTSPGEVGGEFPPAAPLRPQSEVWNEWQSTAPGLLALQTGKQAAEADVKLSRSMALPRLAVGYRYEYSPGEQFNGVKAGISIPMFGNRNNVKRARAQAAFAQASEQAAVVDARAALAELYAREALLASAIAQYSELAGTGGADALLAKALEAGQISLSDYYDQLAPYYEVTLTLIAARRDYHQVRARINVLEL